MPNATVLKHIFSALVCYARGAHILQDLITATKTDVPSAADEPRTAYPVEPVDSRSTSSNVSVTVPKPGCRDYFNSRHFVTTQVEGNTGYPAL